MAKIASSMSRAAQTAWTQRDSGLISRLAVAALLLTASAGPWLIAAVQPPTQAIVIAGISLTAALWLFALAIGAQARATIRIPAIAVVIACGAILGGLQLLPFSVESLREWAPISAETSVWRRLDAPAPAIPGVLNGGVVAGRIDAVHNMVPGAGSDGKNSGANAEAVEAKVDTLTGEQSTVSLVPSATARLSLELASYAAVVVLAASLLGSGPGVSRFLWIVSINGTALALFGIVQLLTWNGKLFWTIPLTQGGQPFASFVNRNAAGGFLVSVAAIAAGLVSHRVQRSWSQQSQLIYAVGPLSLSLRIRALIGLLDIPTILAISMCGLVSLGAMATMSRSAVISLLAAFTGIGIAASCVTRRILPGLSVGLLSSAGVFGLMFIGKTDVLAGRFQRLFNNPDDNARWGLWSDTLRLIEHCWMTGTGLGTFGMAVSPYMQSSNGDITYTHAENVFLQSVSDGGCLGGGLLLIAVLLQMRAAWQLLGAPAESTTGRPMGLALTGVIAGEIAHSMFDFGLYLPAYALHMSLVTGVAMGAAARFRRVPSVPAKPLIAKVGSVSDSGKQAAISANNGVPGAWHPVPAIVLGLVVIAMAIAPAGIIVSEIPLHFAERNVRIHPQFSQVSGSSQSGPSTETVGDLLGILRQCNAVYAANENSFWLRHNAQQLRKAAQLKMLEYRLALWQELRRNPAFLHDDQQIWALTDPYNLHRAAEMYLELGQSANLRALRESPLVRDDLAAFRRLLLRTIEENPWSGDDWLFVAATDWLDDPPFSRHQMAIDRAVKLAPRSSEVQFWAGVLLWQSGEKDPAIDQFRRSLSITGVYLKEVARVCLTSLSPDEFGRRVLTMSPELSVQLADSYRESPHERDMLLKSALRSLEAEAVANPAGGATMPLEARAYWHGKAMLLLGKRGPAIDELRRAVELRPKELYWRYDLALALFEDGQVPAAAIELQQCLKRQPRNATFQWLQRRIDNHRTIYDGEVPDKITDKVPTKK